MARAANVAEMIFSAAAGFGLEDRNKVLRTVGKKKAESIARSR